MGGPYAARGVGSRQVGRGSVGDLFSAIKANVAKVVVGRDETVSMMVVAFLCGGHVLLEDVPGVGKTVMSRSLAASVRCSFKRIQFTPDILPSDVTGIYFYNQKESEFVFREGPIFANVVLADEINRATPRAQSSLLECMAEGQVTIDGVSHALGRPFFVVATQNPIELQGTYPLPEAQMDRFFMRLRSGYPDREDECRILSRFLYGDPMESVGPVCDADDLAHAAEAISRTRVNEAVMGYVTAISEATRSHAKVVLGVSPRGSLFAAKAAQACACVGGRTFVTPDDVKRVAVPVLAHRLILRGSHHDAAAQAEAVIREILDGVPAPTEEF